MRRNCRLPILPLFLILLPLAPAYAATPRTLIASAERVSDGDTIVVLTENGTKLRIRLLGIDAPEIPHGKKPGQPYGEEARDYLDHLIGGRPCGGRLRTGPVQARLGRGMG